MDEEIGVIGPSLNTVESVKYLLLISVPGWIYVLPGSFISMTPSVKVAGRECTISLCLETVCRPVKTALVGKRNDGKKRKDGRHPKKKEIRGSKGNNRTLYILHKKNKIINRNVKIVYEVKTLQIFRTQISHIEKRIPILLLDN